MLGWSCLPPSDLGVLYDGKDEPVVLGDMWDDPCSPMISSDTLFADGDWLVLDFEPLVSGVD